MEDGVIGKVSSCQGGEDAGPGVGVHLCVDRRQAGQPSTRKGMSAREGKLTSQYSSKRLDLTFMTWQTRFMLLM